MKLRETPPTIRESNEDDCGDIVVEDDYGTYLFITYLEENS
jgi:hypothetical protein